MRTIEISTEVFAEIWRRHQPGDQSEEQILRRVLGLGSAKPALQTAPAAAAPVRLQGYIDDRYGVRVPEGFEIYRVFKGRSYRAKAIGGKWLLNNDNRAYQSLNQLSKAVVGRAENAWMYWFFKDAQGVELTMDSLRSSAAANGQQP